jgi:hypothetical protein
MVSNRDHAAVVTTAILQLILSSSTPTAARDSIEDLLRAEFDDVRHQAIADRRLEDPDA